MENTLLRVAGALFCHDAKRARTAAEKIELNRGIRDRNLVIEPHPQFGRPGPLAHKLFVAILKKHSDYGRPVQSEVSFSRREIMRFAGRAKWGGRDSEQFAQALQQIHRTFVTASFKDSSGRFIEESFNIFPRILLVRRARATDPIQQCTIALADPVVASLKDDHFTCLNHAFMRELTTIAQALYMRLFFHFSNHFDGHHEKRLKFEKRYDDICAEWLGGLTVLAHHSRIINDQLGMHLEQLRAAEFLASYSIEAARTRPGFVLTFRPGKRFFADYDRFYRHRHQGELQWRFHDDQERVAEPLKVAYRFIEKRTGAPLAAIPYVTSREVDTARELLKAIPFGHIDNFIDFALKRARETNFNVQSLGGIAQYQSEFLRAQAGRKSRAKEAAALAAQQAQDRREAEYSAFHRAEVKALFQRLPERERAIIGELARAKCKGAFSNSKLMLDATKRQILEERYGEQLTSYRDWSAKQIAA